MRPPAALASARSLIINMMAAMGPDMRTSDVMILVMRERIIFRMGDATLDRSNYTMRIITDKWRCAVKKNDLFETTVGRRTQLLTKAVSLLMKDRIIL